ncbi:MAG: iron-sulfur cluster assembly accessory protein [Pseudomonadota bacterium]
MTVETFEIDVPVRVTDAAAEHFRKSLGAEKSAVRISVAESGCTGFKYVLDQVSDGEQGDSCLALPNGVQVFIDSEALSVLRGTEIDLQREGINKVLKFNNPNVVDECGCGESFSVDQ